MRQPLVTVTRSRRADLVLFVAIVILIVLTGRRRLRVYYESPPPAVSQPR